MNGALQVAQHQVISSGPRVLLEVRIGSRINHLESPRLKHTASGIAREGLQAQESHPFGQCPFNDAAEETVADPLTPVFGSDMDLGDQETVRRISGLHASHSRQARTKKF